MITAVGMVDHLAVMMAAVIIAITLMVLASKALTRFVNSHPTIVILCLSFLLMIGFSTVADGLASISRKDICTQPLVSRCLLSFLTSWPFSTAAVFFPRTRHYDSAPQIR